MHIGLVSALALFAAASSSPAFAALVVSNAPTSNVSCASGVCISTAKKAVLNAGDLSAMLASGDVTVESDALAKSIEIKSALSWTSASRLTLQSVRAISIVQPVLVEGPGGLTIAAHHNDYAITAKGRVEFWDLSSSLIVGGKSFTLVNSLSALASAIAADPGVNVALARTYDAAPDKHYLHAPVPTQFEGTFEGLGNSVSRLFLLQKGSRGDGLLGLFAAIGASATVRDIEMVRTTMDGNAGEPVQMGALASTNAGTILNAYSSGLFLDAKRLNAVAGGLVGVNRGTIASSHSDVTLNAQGSYIGGLAGDNYGTIRDCYAGGQLTGGGAGGLVSVNADGGLIIGSHATGSVYSGGGLVDSNYGTIQNSYATGDVSGAYAGGLAIVSGGSILSSYATGTVTGQDQYMTLAGGLVAYMTGGTIRDSYETGAVSGTAQTSWTGGLIGEFYPLNNDSPSIGNVYASGAVSGSGLDLGGLIGMDVQDQGYIATAYWDLDTTGISDPSKGAGDPANDPGITGLSDATLKSALPAGFDPAVWGRSAGINGGLPYLLANPPQ